ncbi:hypothetical protein GCM10010335_64870 [Streptomyces galbus]|nr:hypothetical protein GCM10010335_64870 [Streptomyces galbus]
MLLNEHLALAAVAALQTAEAATDAHDVTILTAVAEHLSQWGHDPQGLDKKDVPDVVLWRQAVLANTEVPTALCPSGAAPSGCEHAMVPPSGLGPARHCPFEPGR